MNYSHRDSEVIQHYIRYWAQPATVVKFDHDGQLAPNPIFVVEFAPSEEAESWVYATVGASRQPMPYPDDWIGEKPEHRIELFICARQRNYALREVLAGLAVYPFQYKTFIAAGHTIPGTHSIVPDASLTDILFTRAYGMQQDFETIHHSDGSHTHILWVVPIYRSERLFILQYGWQALIDLFFEHKPDISDFSRLQVV